MHRCAERLRFDGQRRPRRFVRAAALEMPRKLRNQRRQPALGEGDDGKYGMDPTPGLASANVAKAYVAAVEGSFQGEIEATRFAR